MGQVLGDLGIHEHYMVHSMDPGAHPLWCIGCSVLVGLSLLIARASLHILSAKALLNDHVWFLLNRYSCLSLLLLYSDELFCSDWHLTADWRVAQWPRLLMCGWC